MGVGKIKKGVMEYWSGGVMSGAFPQYSNTPLLHHSSY
jgi:hypothetical protein